MSGPVVRAEGISKAYRLGLIGSGTLRDDVERWWARLWGRPDPRLAVGEMTSPVIGETIWALRDVCFEVAEGEVLGIVGRNGAGKSTLLKILSRITAPTEGAVRLRGRVASLLEVGTGFHPELTGRQNIFLNGAILGMRRREIDRKLDSIIDFAEIERFIDTPVKRYSSGMYVRLAFAVAAHLEAEILLIDEVLAVGDTAFQRKCVEKVDTVAHGGRTVLFVSHNMGAVQRLCTRCVLLRSGCVVASGPSDEVVKQYLADAAPDCPEGSFSPDTRPTAPLLITRCWLGDTTGRPLSVVDVTQGFSLGLKVLARRDVSDTELSVNIDNALGQPVFVSNLSDGSATLPSWEAGEHVFLVEVPGNLLTPDRYSVSLGLHRPNVEIVDSREHALCFTIVESGSHMWRYSGARYGNVFVRLQWRRL